MTSEQDEMQTCHWCGGGIDGEPVLWDVQERGNREVYFRYWYCSEDCKEDDQWAGPDAERHTEPEYFKRSELEEIHR